MASKITMHKIVATVAVAGTTANAYSKPIRGRILSIKILYTNTTPASSSDRDTNLFEMNPENLTVAKALQEVLNIGSLGAAPEDDNAVYYPRRAAEDNAGTDLVFALTDVVPVEYVIFGRLYLDITAAAAGDITTAYIMVEEY